MYLLRCRVGRDIYRGVHPNDWTEEQHAAFPSWIALSEVESEIRANGGTIGRMGDDGSGGLDMGKLLG